MLEESIPSLIGQSLSIGCDKNLLQLKATHHFLSVSPTLSSLHIVTDLIFSTILKAR